MGRVRKSRRRRRRRRRRSIDRRGGEPLGR